MTKIKVHYDHMDSASQAIRNLSDAINTKLEALDHKLRTVQWTGSAQLEYRRCQDDWNSATAAINQLLNEVGTTVNTAAVNYGDTEKYIRDRWATT
jgi:WXG100 family type VII secretion target